MFNRGIKKRWWGLGIIFLLLFGMNCRTPWTLEDGISKGLKEPEGAVSRSDPDQRTIYLMFTGHEYADGADHIQSILKKHHIKAYFFFTGEFIRLYPALVKALHQDGHYIGPHSDQHLLYCDWIKRDSLLIQESGFKQDLLANIQALRNLDIEYRKPQQRWFMPPYEWYNRKIAEWTAELGWILINFTPGTSTNADYTTPDMPNYRSSEEILKRLWSYAQSDPHGLNGFHLLIHIGTDPLRTDKLYDHLDQLLLQLKAAGYTFP